MEETSKATTYPDAKPAPANGAIWAFIFFIGAFCFAAYGLYRMFKYERLGGDAIVGGDAFNYQILATRGVGLVCVGIVLALAGCGCLLYDLSKKLK